MMNEIIYNIMNKMNDEQCNVLNDAKLPNEHTHAVRSLDGKYFCSRLQ